jgi:adenylate kinase family enzyme
MNKPLLIIITGRPASGKTTLAHIVSKEIKCPVISRDELKEGYINTTGLSHHQSNTSVDLYIYDTFFRTIDLLISKRISIIIEAAFQHKLWQPKLLEFIDKADVRIIICKTNTELTKTRFNERLSNTPDRRTFHGDEQGEKLIDIYEPVNIEASTLYVDTTDDYNPGIEKIINFIKEKKD